MEKIDELKYPPKVGKKYLVPCIIEDKTYHYLDKDNRDSALIPDSYYRRELDIYPIINHLHSDRENGQNYYHYHIDYRFVKFNSKSDEKLINPAKLHSYHNFAPYLRYNIWYGRTLPKIEYYILKCYRTYQLGIAGTVNIAKLKHKCIKNGKCPHRGYDLSQVKSKNGIIECPLHGLKFNAKTKELIENLETNNK